MHNTRGNKCTKAGAYTLVIVIPPHMVTTVQKYCFQIIKKGIHTSYKNVATKSKAFL
jgi:hypothetical protein